MKFEDYAIDDSIKRRLEKEGFRRPTDIQFKSIPPILKGEDVLGIAQTGTGKTAAFAVPILHNLMMRKMKGRADGVKCLIMVPTHELAIQITDVFKSLGKHTRLTCFGIYGGTEQDPQIKNLEKGVDILIATPGRMFDLVGQGYLQLHRVEILVLDEADKMLDLGFYKDIKQLVANLPRTRQTLFFSATISPEIKKLAYSLVNNPIRIQISPKDPVSKNVDHSVAFIEMEEKRFFLERIAFENPNSKILVFVRTKVRAERVCKAMQRVDILADTIHGDKDQKERTDSLTKFKEGKVQLLIATDVSARGIDIKGVQFVVNYDLPEDPENYVHRVGRTGRGNDRGYALSFCSSEERNLLADIEEYITKPIKILAIKTEDRDETIMYSNETHSDWKSLIKDEQERVTKKGKKGGRKRRKTNRKK